MTAIEWTEQTWNPLAGCSIISPGCKNCYAMKQAARIEKMIPSLEHYKGLTRKVNGNVVWTGKVALAPEKTLLEPIQRKTPTMWFVNSMSDLFHEDVPLDDIIGIIAIMALTKRHTYQVLTKRSQRMREVLGDPETPVRVFDAALNISDSMALLAHKEGKRPAWQHRPPAAEFTNPLDVWPLPNIWWGASVERQDEDYRIEDLKATPAAVRFISYEPALGPLELWRWDEDDGAWRGVGIVRSGGRTASTPDSPPEGYDDSYPGIDWVICGGESGPGARPMHPDWARSIRDQCTSAGVPFFFKQWGAWRSEPLVGAAHGCFIGERFTADIPWNPGGIAEGATCMARVGKKAAGRLLDGREWNEMPTIRPEPGVSRGAAA